MAGWLSKSNHWLIYNSLFHQASYSACCTLTIWEFEKPQHFFNTHTGTQWFLDTHIPRNKISMNIITISSKKGWVNQFNYARMNLLKFCILISKANNLHSPNTCLEPFTNCNKVTTNMTCLWHPREPMLHNLNTYCIHPLQVHIFPLQVSHLPHITSSGIHAYSYPTLEKSQKKSHIIT